MEVTGSLKLIKETEDIGTSGFQKREVVITTSEQYSQDLLIQFSQDKCNKLDEFNIGDSVKISINLKGREWTSPLGETKYFNTIEGWRIEKA
jgi:translation initiation factor IF-3